MSALSAAASKEDGDIIKTLQARVADLEAQLYAVGAGGVGSTVARQDHPEQRLDMVPAGWKLVPVEPTEEMRDAGKDAHYEAETRTSDSDAWSLTGFAHRAVRASYIYRAMLAAAPQPPVVEQQFDSDMVSVPRSLLGAACAAINRQQDAPKVLEQLRRYTAGDLSKSAVEQPQVEQEPLFWYRPRSDGMYEGPLHKSQIERVRKESGGWVPLYTHPQPKREPLDTDTWPEYPAPSVRPVYATSANTKSVRDGFEVGGYEKTPPLFTKSQLYDYALNVLRAHGIGGAA